jgi:putative SOS response-associated peptidase YedK
MPVLLAADAEARWLDSGVAFADVSGLLVPYQAGRLRAWEEAPPPDLFA